MSNRLEQFHLNCKKEYLAILNEFNILLYGFGNKKRLLTKMFPSALQFDMNYYTLSDIIYFLNDKYDLECKTLQEIDEELHKSVILIIYDFDFKSVKNFQNLKFFKLIFTLENISKEINEDDFYDLNIVMRDFTTYEDYDYDEMSFKDNKLEEFKNIIRNVTRNSKIIFGQILKFDSDIVQISEIFDKIKKRLLLTRTSQLLVYLTEFVDHKMIKIKEKQFIEVLVNKKYFEELYKECEV